MTATDELRALLDERGVEWGNTRSDGSESDYLTEWRFENGQGKAIAIEWAVGIGLSVEIHRDRLTPAQAIDATLGRGTCRDDNVGGDFVCSECQALVQLHSIGRSYVDKFGKRWYATSNEHGLNFCPNCGRRIVEVDG